MAYLYLPITMKEYAEQLHELRTNEKAMRIAEERWRANRPLTPLEKNCASMHQLIATGNGEMARIVATEVYDNQLDRNVCEETGNIYFHSCDTDNW